MFFSFLVVPQNETIYCTIKFLIFSPAVVFRLKKRSGFIRWSWKNGQKEKKTGNPKQSLLFFFFQFLGKTFMVIGCFENKVMAVRRQQVHFVTEVDILIGSGEESREDGRLSLFEASTVVWFIQEISRILDLFFLDLW